MSKVNKYIAWAIGLPIIALLLIVCDIIPKLGQPLGSIVLLALLLPPTWLVWRAKKETFNSAPTAAASIREKPTLVEIAFNKKLRILGICLMIIGSPITYVGWNIVKSTDVVWGYVGGGALLLVGTIMVGASVGILKVANE